MDPNPIKHPAVLLARVRDAIAPILLEVGYTFDCRNHPIDPGREHLWIDFTHGPDILSLRWNRWYATLTLEFMNANAEVRILVEASLDGVRTHQQLVERMDGFIGSAIQSIRDLYSSIANDS